MRMRAKRLRETAHDPIRSGGSSVHAWPSRTPAKRIEAVVQFVRSVPAFPQSRQCQPSHRVFRGRLGVHTYYGLPTRRRLNAAIFLPRFDHFVTSIAAGIATRPRRPLPGQDLILSEQRTLTAHLDQHTRY